MTRTSDHIRHLTMAALLAAMTTVSIVVFRVPVGQGIVHFGDAVIFLAACLLPKPYALAAAAIGGGMANIVTPTTVWLPATVVIKPAIAACFTSKGHMLCKRNICALFVAAAITIVGYYIWAAVVVYGNWITPWLPSLWGGLIQSGGSAVIFILAAGAIERSGVKRRLAREAG